MKVILGDVHTVCDGMEPESFDSCFCDPPYGLSFMGKDWDHGVPSVEMWRSIYRVLKPGAMLLAFGGTRTHHRLMVAIEDAGFEIRDTLMWIYGTGFPKSYDISKAIDKKVGVDREDKFGGAIGRNIGPTGNKKCEKCGKWLVSGSPCQCPRPQDEPVSDEAKLWKGYRTALKPAWEPIVLAMKPFDGTYAQNALEYGVSGLNIDGSRIPLNNSTKQATAGNRTVKWGVGEGGSDYQKGTGAVYTDGGRFPSNVILDEESGKLLDEQSGIRPSCNSPSNAIPLSKYRPGQGNYQPQGKIYPGDSGGASRFFYCTKASRKERGEGNNHPTVKPLDLCKYLATLIKPPEPGKLLVPFCGSGSEMIGSMMAGWKDVVGIEKEEEYVKIAQRRIEHYSKPFKQKEVQDEFWNWDGS